MNAAMLKLAAALALLWCAGATATPGEDLAARARELRIALAAPADAAAPAQRGFLQQQLLISLERRIDLSRARQDLAALQARSQSEPDAAPPQGWLALDDARREREELDEAIASGEQRGQILHADRDAAAARFTRGMALLRAAQERGAGADALAMAQLEAQAAESAVAELDELAAMVALQQKAAEHQRDVLDRRLAAAPEAPQPGDADAAALEQRLAERVPSLQARLADAAQARDRARAALQDADADPLHTETLKEQLATSDIAIELAREALANHATESTAWQLALRFARSGDVRALEEGRERGPPVRAALERRRDFLKSLSDQVLGRIGLVETQIAQAREPAQTQWRAQRETLQQRLQLAQAAMLDEHRLGALLERLRRDAQQRIDRAPWSERLRLGGSELAAALRRAWNFELFVVDQTVELEGRQTTVPHAVTVAKLVKAPLLLLLGLFLAFRITGWAERRGRRRGIDEGSLRLARRWTLGLVTCACILTSLALAGIPLATFAFVGGAVAIGVGFGMQNLFKNLLSGVLVLIERPFRLGDEIEVGGLRGTVVDIDLRASVLRDGDGSETLIPNATLVEQNVRNVTRQSRLARQTLSFPVASGADPRRVLDALRESAQRHGLVSDAREPAAYLDEVSGDAQRYVLHYWIALGAGVERRRIASDLRLMVLNAFADAGIALAAAVVDVRLLRAQASGLRSTCSSFQRE